MRTVMLLVVALGVWASPAMAQTGATAPAYPGNTLALSAPGPLVAGTVVKVKLAGHAQWNDGATSAATVPYDLSMYVQNADVTPHCAISYSQQLQSSINLPGLNASASISGFVMQSSFTITPAVPSPGIDWSTDTLPFGIRPGLDHVVLCAYQRYVTDDVAYSELPVTVRQPACSATRSTLRRGAKLVLRCNISGAAKVRFSGPRKRTVSAAVAPKDGVAKVSTSGLKAGSYRVAITVGEVALATTLRVRLR